VSESFDDVVREYISFVNEQVGTYMDALAGFAVGGPIKRPLSRAKTSLKQEK
jgi:hypothetical protein